MAACLFCIVFLSSLRFSTETATDVTRGLQFLANDEKSAQALVNDLKAIPEIGTVRWMGAFMPQNVEQKQNILRNLKGSLDIANVGGSVGPNDLGSDVQAIESGLRVISDVAGTDVGLASSAHQFRRSLAVLFNTSDPNTPVEVELEKLIFAGFAELPKRVDEIAMLQAPALTDFDENLRKQFVSEAGHWRVEALPRRIIAEKNFINSVQHLSVKPLGPLVLAQSELNTLQSIPAGHLTIGLLIALMLAFAYLQKVLEWFIVGVGTLMPLAIYAALAVTTDTVIYPLTIPAIVIASAANVNMTLLTVAHRRKTATARLDLIFPVALVLAIVVPLQFVQIREFAQFSRSLVALLLCSLVFNGVVVQQLLTWLDGWNRSRSRLQQPGIVA
jgi:hypothetical protein